MEIRDYFKEFAIILLAAAIISLAYIFPQRDPNLLFYIFLSLFIIILINTLAKKFFAYHLETDVKLSFWSMYYYWFTQRGHFKNPLTLIWLPLIASLISLGNLIWMPIIEFDVAPRPERISRRHGLYRYTEVTEWHVALIAAAGIFATILFGVIGYFAGFETFARLSIFYAAWSIVPLGKLDGSKIFFGSRILWFTLLIALVVALIWGISII